MDKLCEMTIEVGGHKKDREKEIIKACMVEWNFREDDFFHHPANNGKNKILEASALGTLYDDYDEKDVISRLERAVWRMNGSICHVEVRAMRLGKPTIMNMPIEEELQIA